MGGANDNESKRKEVERYGRWLMEGFLATLGKWVLITLFVVVVIQLGFDHFRVGFDGSDNMATGQRSQMTIRYDHDSGCQYLESSDGGLTPRLDRNGKQYC